MKRHSRGGRLSKEQRKQLKDKVLKRLIEAKAEMKLLCSHEIRYKTVDGKQVEIEYDETQGLRNAVHLLMDNSTRVVFNYLVEDLKVPIDEICYNGTSPFYVQVKNRINKVTYLGLLGNCVERLLDMGAKIDNEDAQG